MTAILWPDIEAALIYHLSPLVAAAPLAFADQVRVSNALTDKAGDQRPEYALIVRNDGGPPAETVFADVRAGFNVWAAEAHEAQDLAAFATALINGMPEHGGSPFVDAEASVAYAIPDDSGQAHLYFTATLRVRGADL